jgi:hypothetical protein
VKCLVICGFLWRARWESCISQRAIRQEPRDTHCMSPRLATTAPHHPNLRTHAARQGPRVRPARLQLLTLSALQHNASFLTFNAPSFITSLLVSSQTHLQHISSPHYLSPVKPTFNTFHHLTTYFCFLTGVMNGWEQCSASSWEC